MHVLLLPSWYPATPDDVGGVFFRDQALALSAYGHQVGVIAPRLRSLRGLLSKEGSAEVPYFENDHGMPTYRRTVLAALPRIPHGNAFLYTRAARKLMKDYVREHGRPDVIHAHSIIFGGVAAVTIGREWQIPVVLTEHSSGFGRNAFSAWQLKLARAVAEASKSRICVSPALGALLDRQVSGAERSWKWIPNVVSGKFENASGAQRHGGRVRFLNLALMKENKGQKDLLRAFRHVLDAGIDGELCLAGDGPIREELKRMASELGIEDKVAFPGLIPPDQVPALLEQTDVMVIASHYETFGVVAAEALMAGVPVVATRSGGPECIVEEGDGLLVPTRQPEAMAEALCNVAANLDDYVAGDIAGRARSRFSGHAVAKQLTQEYERVTAARPD